MALYDAEARFVMQSGETLVGHDAIRKVVSGLIGAKTKFHSRVVRIVTVGDIAQLYTDLRARRSIAPGIQCQFTAKPSKCSAASPTAVGN